MQYKINHMFWEINESTGFRHIDLEYNSRILLSVVSHKLSSIWTAQVIPMGFSFELDEVQAFSDAFLVLPKLMEYMQTEEITSEEIQNFLLTI